MLTAVQLRNKRTKREQRRKKLRALHKRELAKLNAGDLRVIRDVRQRKLRIRRKHHLPKGEDDKASV